MRAILVAIVVAFGVFGAASGATAGAYQGNGVYSGTPSAVVTTMFASFPNGGSGLITAIRQLIINNPSLADDVAFVGSQSNADQQSAAGSGLAQAFLVLLGRGNNGGAARIVSAAQQSSSSPIQIAVANVVGTTIGFNTFQANNSTSGTNCTTTQADNTVSPARPASTTCQ